VGSIACNGVVKAITKASTSIDNTINGMGKAFINQQWQEVMNLSFRVRGRQGAGGRPRKQKCIVQYQYTKAKVCWRA
jgi:hypothetical protein